MTKTLLRCFFHFVKAIKKNAKKFGLSKDEKFVRPILEACCIALLPNNYIKEGFEYVRTQRSDSSRWDRFCAYWDRQWAISNISVYGLRNRTDNFSETLNRSTNLLSGKPHQNIWQVIRTIRKVEMEKTDELLEHVLGKIFKLKQNRSTTYLNTKIVDAMLKFEETEDVGSFLKNVSYRSDFLLGKRKYSFAKEKFSFWTNIKLSLGKNIKQKISLIRFLSRRYRGR